MVEESVLLSLLKSLDVDKSAAPAAEALKNIFDQTEQKAPIAATLAGMVKHVGSEEGKRHALNVLLPYAPDVPETVDVAVELTGADDWQTRQSAASFLAAGPTNVKARAALYILLDDLKAEVKNVAITAVGSMDHNSSPEGVATALYLISDDEQRQQALEILDELESAVNTLQELADLTEGQDEIVNNLILPDIAELKNLFGAEYKEWNEVVPGRKQSLITLSGAFRAAEALVLSVAGIANADEAAANVTKTVQLLQPLVEVIKDSI